MYVYTSGYEHWIHIDYIKYDSKNVTCSGSAAKGLRTWVTMQERFLFSDIVIYFVAINCNCFFLCI